jgi:hypothetical protein
MVLDKFKKYGEVRSTDISLVNCHVFTYLNFYVCELTFILALQVKVAYHLTRS